MNTGLKPGVNHTCEGCVSALAESGSGYAAAVNRLLKAVFARVTPPLRHRHIRNRIITIVTFTFITQGGKHEVEKKQYDENTTEYQLAKQQQSSKQHSGIFRFFARKHPARDSIARWRRSGGFACGANISGTPAASDRSCLCDCDGESQLHATAYAD
jgi:hypothetical protein